MNEQQNAQSGNNENSPLAGSSPAKRTIFPKQNEENGLADTPLTHETPEPMRFPKKIKHRGRTLAKIYKGGPGQYRVSWVPVGGRRTLRRFTSYAEAKQYADGLVKDLARGSQVTALSPPQARDALAGLQRLEGFFQSTGRRVSLLVGISEYCEAAGRLNGHALTEAVTGFLGSVATVRRKDIEEGIEEFLAAEQPRTVASKGQRAQLSAKYAYNRATLLRRFASTFPATAFCDLTKEHLDKFIGSPPVSEFSAKSRNHHRAVVQQILQWAVRKDYLAATHRLGEADGLRPEHANTTEVQIYTPKEFRALLETAEGSPFQPMIAIGGLAGLRTAEILRLDWSDVWRIPGHIEVTSSKSKTRQRRLVEVCPALQSWLEPFRNMTGRVWPASEGSTETVREVIFQQRFLKLCETAGVSRRQNGLRHSFCSFHFATNSNENLTASLAGNSPTMIHSNYKGLATKAEAEKWFNVKPARARNIIPLARGAEK